jgi:rare lipoprotein A (peptidoglycan hydrolase)
VGALALRSPSHHSEQTLPKPVLAPGGSWYQAVAGVRRGGFGRRTACGQILRPTTLGVADPVLPCGAKIFITTAHGPRVLTQVIDRGPYVPGRRFDLTEPLAEKLGVHGVQPVQWAFAQAR